MNKAALHAIALVVLLGLGSGCFYAAGAAAGAAAASGGGGSSSKKNATPVATVQQPSRSVDGDLDIQLVLRDDDEENLDITVEYSVAGGPYQTATPATGSTTTDLASSAAGEPHTFVWDYATDIGTGALSVTLRVTPIDDKGAGVDDETTAFIVGNDAPTVTVVFPSATVLASTTFAGAISFEYDLADSSSDPSTLTAEFSVDGTNYSAATTLSSGTSNLLPGRHTFVWESEADVAAADFEGIVDFRLLPSDGFASGAAAQLSLDLDNNAVPDVLNLFDAASDTVSPVIIPFVLWDDEEDDLQVIVQWTTQPNGQFADLDDVSLNPFVDPNDALYVGASMADAAVRAAVLADDAVRSALRIVTETRAEVGAVAGASSTLSLLVAPGLHGARPLTDFEGATVTVGMPGNESSTTASLNGLTFDLSPSLPSAVGPVPGAPVTVSFPAVQGRDLTSSVDGALHIALWDAAADLPSTTTVATRVIAYDSDAGPDSTSVRVDRGIRGNLVASESADVGDGPASVATGDLDSDGRDDIATANVYDDSVTVLLSGSLGLLENGSEVTLDPGGTPIAVGIGDFNDDGRDDLVAVRASVAAIFLQDNAGALPGVPTDVVTGAEPSAIAVGDLNDDSLDDIVIASGPGGSTQKLWIYLQDAVNGITAATATFDAGEVPSALAIGDLDNDGLNDLAAVNVTAGTVTIYLQAPDNSLPTTPSLTINVGLDPAAIAVGDLDGDALYDIAVTSTVDQDTVTVLLQDPSGGFTSPQIRETGDDPVAVAIADVNDDSEADLVTVNNADFTLSVFLGESGSLPSTPSAVLQSGELPSAIAIGDLGGDGDEDIVVANQGDPEDAPNGPDSVLVFVSDPPGRLSDIAAATLTGSFGPEGLAVGDVNGDGQADLVVVTADEAIDVYHQDFVGALPHTPSFTIDVGAVLDEVAIGDLNGDGLNDVVTAAEDEYLVYLQNADGSLPTTPSALLTGVTDPDKMVIGDLNGDGRNDLAVLGEQDENDLNCDLCFFYVFLQDAQGNLATTPSSAHATGAGADDPEIGDLNGDGRDDVIIVNADDDSAGVYFQTSSGTLPTTPSLELTTDESPEECLVADLDSDGFNDLATLNKGDAPSVTVYFYDETTGLPTTPSLTLALDDGAETFAAGDLDGNGRADLVVTNAETGIVSIFLQDVDGLTDTPNQELVAGFEPDAQAIGDLNGDGRDDLAVSNNGELGVAADDVIRIYVQE